MPGSLPIVSAASIPFLQVVGVVGLAHAVRPGAPDAIAALRALGVEVYVVSGDSDAAARATATELGIKASNVLAQCSPAEKVAAIRSLQVRSLGTLRPCVVPCPHHLCLAFSMCSGENGARTRALEVPTA